MVRWLLRDVDGTLTGAADGLGYGTAEEAEIAIDPEFVEKAALIKYHATMMRRQLVRDLCVVYENIFDQAAEWECKSIALPGAVLNHPTPKECHETGKSSNWGHNNITHI